MIATLPPLAPHLPATRLAGHLAEARRDPLGLFVRALRQRSDVVRLRVGPLWFFLVLHPSAVREVLVEREANYDKRSRGYRMLRKLLGQGLLTSEGETWARHRRIANPAFRRQTVAGFATTIGEHARDHAERWQADEVIDVAEEMSQLTLAIAARTLFGADLDDRGRAIGDALSTVLRWHDLQRASLVPWRRVVPTLAGFRARRAEATLDRTVRAIVDARHGQTPRPDFLGLLMATQDEETGQGLTDQELRDEVLTLLLAGHETTANTLAWTLYLLSRNPGAARALEAEVDRVLPGGTLPVMGDLGHLPYTEAVVKESMRLYPAAWAMGRRAVTADTLGGFRVPAGAQVYLSPYAVHRHPDYWADPEGFDPERWLEGRTPSERFAYLPFGGGKRQCIGSRFAMMETCIVLAVLVRRFRFSLLVGHRVEPEPSVTLRPRGGLPMTVHPR